MAIFALADLHLSKTGDKSMDIFGKHWENHTEKILSAWNELVTPEDTVLIPGDISWAMKLSEAMEDIACLEHLPGEKVFLRGNHDYWWSSIQRLRGALPNGFFALQNDCFITQENYVICGTRGWILPGLIKDEADEKIYMREVSRLKLSLESAKKAGKHPDLVMMHYPPVGPSLEKNGFMQLFEEYEVPVVIYGHIHGTNPQKNCMEGFIQGIEYHLVSCDYLNFAPKKILG